MTMENHTHIPLSPNLQPHKNHQRNFKIPAMESAAPTHRGTLGTVNPWICLSRHFSLSATACKDSSITWNLSTICLDSMHHQSEELCCITAEKKRKFSLPTREKPSGGRPHRTRTDWAHVSEHQSPFVTHK